MRTYALLILIFISSACYGQDRVSDYKTKVDDSVTNKTAAKSITAYNIGSRLKEVADLITVHSDSIFAKIDSVEQIATDSTLYVTISRLIDSLNGYVPAFRTLTINGATYDLSQNRSWTIDVTPDLHDVLGYGALSNGRSAYILNSTIAKKGWYVNDGPAEKGSLTYDATEGGVLYVENAAGSNKSYLYGDSIVVKDKRLTSGNAGIILVASDTSGKWLPAGTIYDPSSTNEIQQLSVGNDTIYLSNGGGYVVVPCVCEGGGTVSYNDLTDVPLEFAPSAHTHAVSEVTGLQGALDSNVKLIDSNVVYVTPTELASELSGYVSAETDPIFTASDAFSITSTDKSNWTAGYNDKINSAAFTGTSTKTLTLTQQDGGTVTANFTDQGITSETDPQFDTKFAAKTTDDLAQGSANKYFSTTLARGSISAGGDLSYDNATGVMTYTEPDLSGYALQTSLDDSMSVIRDSINQLRADIGSGGGSTDTSSLSARIDARVKYTDTAAMLSPYLRKIDTTNKWLPIGTTYVASETDPLSPHLSDSTVAYVTPTQMVAQGYITGYAETDPLSAHTSDSGSVWVTKTQLGDTAAAIRGDFPTAITYSNGYGLDLSGTTFSVDTGEIATQYDISGFQAALNEGFAIDIVNSGATIQVDTGELKTAMYSKYQVDSAIAAAGGGGSSPYTYSTATGSTNGSSANIGSIAVGTGKTISIRAHYTAIAASGEILGGESWAIAKNTGGTLSIEGFYDPISGAGNFPGGPPAVFFNTSSTNMVFEVMSDPPVGSVSWHVVFEYVIY